MKKLLTLTAACALLTAPAMAVQKCVAYNEAYEEPDSVEYLGAYEWRIHYQNITITGISACASSAEQVKSELVLDNDSEYFYCYCKSISPFVSKWAWADAEVDEFLSLEQCMSNCSNQCIVNISDYSLKTGLYNNVMN